MDQFIDADGHIVMTAINAGYFDYLHNLWRNIKRTDIKWTLCTVCMDSQASELCRDAGIPSVPLSSDVYESADIRAYSSWNDANWNKTTFLKLNAILQIVADPRVKMVTYMDSDIHIFRDFVPDLKSAAASDPATDLWIQSDHNSLNAEEHGWALCSGFFHFRNEPRVTRIFEYSPEDVRKYKFNSDQEHLVAQIQRHGVPTKQLSRNNYPNGVFVNNNKGVGIPQNAFLIHYNYLVGHEKKRTMAKHGHWYLTALNILHHKTQTVYPPFKDGLYLEEYFSRRNPVRGNRYIDVHWTNIQIEPRFRQIQPLVQKLVDELYPINNGGAPNKYFTIVQHDDGVMFRLPPNTVIYNAGGNGNVMDGRTVPIPLIYEDRLSRLQNVPKRAFGEKDVLCSFVGSMTHPVRAAMRAELGGKPGFELHFTEQWTNILSEEKQRKFVDITSRSKFCLAPRGYGRTSFRFYEAFLLGTVPIYIWDDVEWLPYKDERWGRQPLLDYSEFAISINVRDLSTLESRLRSIGEEEYNRMLEAYRRVHWMFTLEGMTEYIVTNEELRDNIIT